MVTCNIACDTLIHYSAVRASSIRRSKTSEKNRLKEVEEEIQSWQTIEAQNFAKLMKVNAQLKQMSRSPDARKQKDFHPLAKTRASIRE